MVLPILFGINSQIGLVKSTEDLLVKKRVTLKQEKQMAKTHMGEVAFDECVIPLPETSTKLFVTLNFQHATWFASFARML
jgi:hypothetical protein